jgi:hypothetical protein
MNGNGPNWLDILGDGFLLLVLFALWLWQFESSAKSSLYHFILAAIGLVCLIGVCVLVAVIVISALSSRWGS